MYICPYVHLWTYVGIRHCPSQALRILTTQLLAERWISHTQIHCFVVSTGCVSVIHDGDLKKRNDTNQDIIIK